ncbi:reverse transcriptase domain-containing protein [Tanacetum coccineum]
MDDEPMWAADHVVALTPGSAITIPETANEFAIKGNHLTLVKGNQFDGRTKTDPHKHIHEFLRICDMFKYIDTENEVVRLMMFPLSLTGEAKTWLDELNEGTIEIEITQEVLNAAVGGIFLYKTPNQAYQLLEDKVLLKLDWAKNQKTKSSFKKTVTFVDEAMIQNKVPPKLRDPGSFLIPCNFNKTFSCNALADVGASINLMPYSLYAKLSLETIKPTTISVSLADRSFQYPIGIAENMLVEVGKFTFPTDFVILEMEEDSKVPLILGRPFLHTADAVIRVKQKQLNLGVGTERMIFTIDSRIKHSYSNDDTCISIDEILEEDFDPLLDEGSKILHSIEGTLLEKEIFLNSDDSWK